jgi:Tfp pilus assembly protein PilV
MKTQRAFTLIEVMIATGIFFMAMFAILTLVSQNLRNARKLQDSQVDAGPLIAELSLTNKLTEGEDSGDFGDLYPGYEWTREITEVGTNGLFQVDFAVYNRSAQPPVETHTSVLLFRPDSTTGTVRP